MTIQDPLHAFLLIDASQLAAADLGHLLPQPAEAPSWLAYVYEARAAAVSPLLIDMALCDSAGDCSQMMALANAVSPRLHASFIDTPLSLTELTAHLRRFIMVRNNAGKGYTLRFADCAVLPVLASVLAPPQWAALTGPLTRWCVHGFDDMVNVLPSADRTSVPTQTPLMLSDQQIAALSEAGAPSMMLAHLRDMNHGHALPGSLAQQHQWASQARSIWRSSGIDDDIVLRWLTSAALESRGEVLGRAHLESLLASGDREAIRESLLSLIEQCPSPVGNQ